MAERHLSLRRQLIARMVSILLPLVLLLWAVAYYTGLYFIDVAFDRSLKRRTYALADRVEVVKGRVRVDLPVAARELLAFDQEDLLAHSIAGPSGEVVEGITDMPPLPDSKALKANQVLLYNATKDGETVRIAAFALSLKGTSAKGNALIRVSETITHRNALARRATLAIIAPVLLMTLTAAAAIAYGVGRGLEPVRRLRDQIMARSALDLRPIPLADTPAELHPFLDEINSLLNRLSDSVDAQSRFVADAAHQLRTPIAGIRAQAEAALTSSQPDDARHALQRIADAATRMGNLVQKLLVLARVDAAENTIRFQRLDSAEVMGDISRDWAPRLLAAGVEIELLAEKDAAPLMGDVQLLHEMLANLIDNVQRYGGTQITLNAYRDSDSVIWNVLDNGPGIAAHQYEEVFAPFHRLSTSIDGAGIGLTIVARIARLHGAQIELGKGLNDSGLGVRIRFAAAQ